MSVRFPCRQHDYDEVIPFLLQLRRNEIRNVFRIPDAREGFTAVEREACIVLLEEGVVSNPEYSTCPFSFLTSHGVAAYVNYCPHAGHPLNFRPHKFLTPDGSLILCASHGAVFTRDTGECVIGPCAGQSLKKIDVEVVGGCVVLADGVDVEKLANEPL